MIKSYLMHHNINVQLQIGYVTIFSVTLKSQITSFYQWKPKNNGPILFKIILLVL